MDISNTNNSVENSSNEASSNCSSSFSNSLNNNRISADECTDSDDDLDEYLREMSVDDENDIPRPNTDNNDQANISESAELLYENSKITVDQCVFDLLNYYVRYKITKAALEETLKMQINMLPADNNMPKTLFQLFQYVERIAPPCKIIKHFYCKMCLFYIGTNEKVERCASCDIKRNNGFFFEFDICDQITYLFEKKNLQKN